MSYTTSKLSSAISDCYVTCSPLPPLPFPPLSSPSLFSPLLPSSPSLHAGPRSCVYFTKLYYSDDAGRWKKHVLDALGHNDITFQSGFKTHQLKRGMLPAILFSRLSLSIYTHLSFMLTYQIVLDFGCRHVHVDRSGNRSLGSSELSILAAAGGRDIVIIIIIIFIGQLEKCSVSEPQETEVEPFRRYVDSCSPSHLSNSSCFSSLSTSFLFPF